MQCLCGRDDHASREARHLRQYSESLRNDVLMWGEAVPRQGFPLDKVQDVESIPGEKANLGLQLIGMPCIAGQHEYGSFRAGREFRGRERGAGTNESAPGDIPALARSRRCW